MLTRRSFFGRVLAAIAVPFVAVKAKLTKPAPPSNYYFHPSQTGGVVYEYEHNLTLDKDDGIITEPR